jgi:hypothetical protein
MQAHPAGGAMARPKNLKSMPACAPNPDGTAIEFRFVDTNGRDYLFSIHPDVVGEITLKLAIAASAAASARGETTTPGGHQVVRAMIAESTQVQISEADRTVLLSLFLAESHPLDFALTPERASSLSERLAEAAARLREKPTSH